MTKDLVLRALDSSDLWIRQGDSMMFNELKHRPEYYPSLAHERIGKWMSAVTVMADTSCTLRDASYKLMESRGSCLPIVDGETRVVGIMTKSNVIHAILKGISLETPVSQIMVSPATTFQTNSLLEEAFTTPYRQVPIVDEDGVLVGMLSERDIVYVYMDHFTRLSETETLAESLNTVLESAYEGIVLVDAQGIIRELNRAYVNFLGISRESAVGKHVTEVIQNTRMHEVIKSGVPERGYLQVIEGQEVIVHRIPIWTGDQVIGAIGMIIFEGVTELYKLLSRIEELSGSKDNRVEFPYKPLHERTTFTFDRIIGNDPETAYIKHIARRIARTPSTVLITGESGTGKEMFAKAIHYNSGMFKGPFVSLNCAAIPEHLLEAELFGYEEGAFTGARKGGKPGKFELANKGTIFLDEIGDMPLSMQAKILRVLEEREVERIGGVTTYDVQVRIIAATNRNLEEMIAAGAFREDLFYRLNIIRLELPPLRKRKQDIPLLVSHQINKLCSLLGVSEKQFSKEAMALFMNYDWPGNIRELVNTVEALIAMAEGSSIGVADFPDHILKRLAPSHPRRFTFVEAASATQRRPETNIKQQNHDHEMNIILETLQELNGNKTAVAKKLGIHRSTLYEKIKKYTSNPNFTNNEAEFR